jgi:sirohydrochlorin cobaltochelatase
MNESLLVLFVHGSRDPLWRSYFERLTRDLQGDLGPERVQLAYMEFASPTLEDVVSRAVSRGVGRIVLLPFFFSGGAHVAEDIPEQVEAVRKRFPALPVEVLPPVGEHRRFVTMLKQLAWETARDMQLA